MTEIAAEHYFPCPVYLVDAPQFVPAVTEVSEAHLTEVRQRGTMDTLYPVCMSGSYHADPRLKEFCGFIGESAWAILDQQGYDMSRFHLSFSEMWTQEHHKQSSMEQHVHGFGAQIVGFYFLEVPENSSRVVFHDPRASKVMIDLPQKDISQATVASQMIHFEPRVGMAIFSNSWLPHSFTRNPSDKPIKFVHFNLHAVPAQQHACPAPAEVV